MKEKRRDNKGRILHTGESQRTDGKYLYKYVDAFGNTKYVYAWRLTPTDPTPKGKREKPSLRELEQQIRRDIEDGIDSTGKKMTLCQLYAKQNAQRANVKKSTQKQCILLAFGIIAHKSRNPRILRRLPLPAIPMVLLGVYAVLYGFHFPLIKQFLGDMTIVHCLMTAASLEGGLRCGLIQSNTGYEELLRVTSLAVQLVDRQGNVYCCSENGRMVDRRELQAAMNGTVQLDEHTLLRSAPVQGGYVMWQTDITELVENMERLKENRTELAERNYLEQQNYEVERKINALREKNRLYDLLQRQLAPQIIRMDQLLTRYRAAPEEEKRQLLGQVAVLGAYLKRGANLMFLAQQHRYVPSAELRYALEESISSLELAGVECAMEVTHGVRLPAEAAAACYSRFESVVEGALGQLDALFVRAIWKDQRLNLYLSVETGADLKAACPAAVQEAPGSWVLNDHFEGGAPECGTN